MRTRKRRRSVRRAKGIWLLSAAVVGDVSRGGWGAIPRTSDWNKRGRWRVRGSGSPGEEQSDLFRQACSPLGDRDIIIPFDLVQEDIDPGDETLVGHGWQRALHNGRCRRQGYGAGEVQGYRLAPPPDPSEGVVDGSKFPCIAGRPHGTNPGGAVSGRDNRSPKRLSFVGARDSDLDSPACRAVGKLRTVREQESDGGGSSNKGLRTL